jgi:beta-lactam-binding protein with PASTA domain
VKVPDVVGMDRFSAIAELEALGLEVLLEEEPTDDTTKVNYVLSQEPVGGNVVVAGATVTIWVGVPNDMVLVPSLIGMSQAAAETALAGVGLVPKVTAVDSTLPGGTVLTQDPPASTQVPAGSTVAIEVSNAPISNLVNVPPVAQLGYTVAQAKSILSQFHLKATVEYYETEAFPAGEVIQQNPVAGKVVAAGTTVTLTVAKVPTTTISTEPPSTEPQPPTTPPSL